MMTDKERIDVLLKAIKDRDDMLSDLIADLSWDAIKYYTGLPNERCKQIAACTRFDKSTIGL